VSCGAELDAALAAARASGQPQHLVVRRALAPGEAALDPIAWLGAGADAEERFYLERPSAGCALVALGSACAYESGGDDRFARASAWLKELRARTHAAGGDADRAAQLVGGFAFAAGDAPAPGSEWEAFPNLRIWLPRLLVTRDARGTWLAHAIRVEPGMTRDALRERAAAAERAVDAPALAEVAPLPAQRIARPARSYRRLVAGALDAIAKGEAEKIVAARALELAGSPAPLRRVLRALREAHPHCAVFAVAPRGGAAPVFAGATPELLVRVSGRTVEAQALAGSAGRGRTAAQDARARRALLASAKERREHAIVVSALEAALAPVCEEMALEDHPHALRLSGLQHLETRVRARLAEGERARLLELAARLHPSPAVLGAPRAAAARWLACHESLDRGWYAGGIGALDLEGNGELFVALRCALLRADGARLFAGAGIVAGSQPAAEARETRLKLRALLRALGEASRARG
jgi:salicylate biosynthesis isochorismate synthase